MAITRIGSAGGVASATIPAHQAGDLIVAFAFRDGSTIVPTFPSGQNWLSPPTSFRQGTTCGHRLVFKIATSSSEATGTFTNATSVEVAVYRGVDQVNPLGANDAVNSGVGTTITFGSVTYTKTDNTSWAVSFTGHRSTDVAIETAPAGMTNVNSVSDATDEAAVHDTNGPVTTWASASANVGGTSSGWTSQVIEIRAAQNQVARSAAINRRRRAA